MLSKYHTIDKRNYFININKKLKIHKINLALVVRDILNKHNYEWFLEAGTLLGAYRNGKMIEHDDDIDFAIYDTNKLEALFNILQAELPTKYECKHIKTYANKIEVYDKTHGKTNLDHIGEYHLVTIDLQLYLNSDKNNIYGVYTINNYDKLLFDKKNIFPVKKVIFEKYEFNAPNDIEKFLTPYYGCLNENALYNPITFKYELIPYL